MEHGIKRKLSVRIPTEVIIRKGYGWSKDYRLMGSFVCYISYFLNMNNEISMFLLFILLIILLLIIPSFYLIKYLLRIRVHRIKKIFLILIPFFAVYIVVTQFIIDLKHIVGNSMYPALKNGDRILIKKYDKNYQRGDIIIFKSLKNPDIEYISRLIALPKDKIKIQERKVYLNGKILQEPYTKTPTSLWEDGFIKKGEEYKVPDSEVFVMGDNRPRSSDSREFGFIIIPSIIGKYSYRYYEGKYEPTKEDKVNDLFYKGETLYLNSQDDEAIKYFKEIISIEPSHQESLIYLADIFTRKKQYEKADLYFKKSFQINKNNAYLLAKYGYYLQSKGNETEAEEYFKKALVINKTLFDALFGLGYINFNKGQYSKAEEYYNKIIATGINDASTFHNLGAIYFNLENYTKAKEFYNKALNLYKEKGQNKEYEELNKFMQDNRLN